MPSFWKSGKSIGFITSNVESHPLGWLFFIVIGKFFICGAGASVSHDALFTAKKVITKYKAGNNNT